MTVKKLRYNADRAKIATRLIQISALVSLLTICIGIFKFIILYNIHFGRDISEQTAKTHYFLTVGVLFLYLVVSIISAVTFIQWFRRAYYNQEVKFEYMNTTNGWAAGAWFVPVLNLYKPYQMIRELFEEAENYLVNTNSGLNKKSGKQILAWWWGLWIFVKIATFLNARISLISYSTERLMKLNIISILTDILQILLAYLTIKFIRDYNNMEMKILYGANSDKIEMTNHHNSGLLDTHFD